MAITPFVSTLVIDAECVRMAKREGAYDRIMAAVHQAKMQGHQTGANYDFNEYERKFVAYMFFWGCEKPSDNGWIRIEGIGFSKEQMRRLNEMMIGGLDYKEIFSYVEDINRN